jgi:hypothetical protein
LLTTVEPSAFQYTSTGTPSFVNHFKHFFLCIRISYHIRNLLLVSFMQSLEFDFVNPCMVALGNRAGLQDRLTVFSQSLRTPLRPSAPCDVPILIPGINSEQAALLKMQKKNRGWKGFITPNPNCTTTGLAITLKPVYEAFGIRLPNQVLLMFHCGSRGFGHQVATDYLQKFLAVMQSKYGIQVLDRELACAPFRSPEGQDYFKA